MEHREKDEGESGDVNMVAIESAGLEISLSSVEIITTKLITDGEAIVQATKSVRNFKLLRWGTINGIGSVLFIGTPKREYSNVIPSVCWPRLPTPSTLG